MAAEIRKSQNFSNVLEELSLVSWVIRNLPKIALSLTVFEINNIFHFRQNSRWRLKWQLKLVLGNPKFENSNFVAIFSKILNFVDVLQE